MKPINYTKQFQKNLLRRFAHQPKIIKQFRERTLLFQRGVRGNPLDDHPLRGNMQGFRAYSVAGDVCFVYRELEAEYEFVDIGTHNQVYK